MVVALLFLILLALLAPNAAKWIFAALMLCVGTALFGVSIFALLTMFGVLT